MLRIKGFSLLEILLVIAIGTGLFLFSAPLALNFYRNQSAEEVRSNLMDALVRAKHNAILQKNDSDFGVTLSEVADSYVIFQGSTYNDRESSQDEIFEVTDNTNFTGLTDIIFSKLTGLPSATGTIYVNYGAISKGILIGDSGSISKTN